ncbi:MAG: hypothetical protein JO001_01650 [Alphaproteobacteria bacterium]|nr:hypothetical protein [Alphaproteobacteria bacterium]
MVIRRVLGRSAAAVVVVCAVSLPASADGLSRFEAAIKQAPPGMLTYKGSKSLGDNGFVLENVVLTPPPDKTGGGKSEPINIKRVSVEDFDFASVDKNQPPNFIKVRAEGILISGKPTEGVDLKQMADIDNLTADFQLDYRFEPDRKTLTLNRLELDLAGLARMDLTLVLDGVTAEELAKPDSAMNDATLRTATLTFEDRTLLSKVLPAVAKMQGADADALIKMGKAMLDGVRAGQGTETVAVIDAVGSYMDDYKQPKGPLKITLNPPGKTSAAVLQNAKTPDEAIKALGLVVTYSGTKTQTASAATAPPSSSSAASGNGGSCTPGARFFVMHEEAWWSVTVRQAEGDKCTARIDGADDDVTFATDKSLAWSIDGPGKAVTKCSSGDKVLVQNDGGWYPAQVTDKPFSDGKCAIKFTGGDQDEDTVELKGVRRLD